MACAVLAEFVFQEGKVEEGVALLESPAGLFHSENKFG